MDRRWLPGVVALTLALHAAGMVQTQLPAQDGLKFLRIAGQFQSEPWLETIRGSDQHPLYSILTALTQPLCALIIENPPVAWRTAGQLVSLLAYLAALIPLYGLTRFRFGKRTARLAVFLFVLLPMPAELGRDTLSDATALALFAYAVWLGELALDRNSARMAIGAGLAVAVGYWARPEVALAAIGFGVAAIWSMAQTPGRPAWRTAGLIVAMGLVVALGVGSYAWAKGELTEKLMALLGRGSLNDPVSGGLRMPAGLDNPAWDFSPKEESSQPSERTDLGTAVGLLGERWAESMGWVFLPAAAIGACLSALRPRATKRPGSSLVPLLIAGFAVVLIGQAVQRGYLSNRHVLLPTFLAMPWAAWGVRRLHLAFVRRIFPPSPLRRHWGWAVCGFVAIIAAFVQTQPSHPTRWGHFAAGCWIAERAAPGEAILDTRGWANYVAGQPGYDYWHVKQALSDSRLTYIVVEADELNAQSQRAVTLRALLEYSAREVASFPQRQEGSGKDVLVYRFERPANWEGMRP